MDERDDITGAPPEGDGGAARDAAAQGAASQGGDQGDARDAALRAVQVALGNEIDAAIAKLERARLGENTREHLEILRSLLKAQVTAYLDHFIARRATLFSQTSLMYAGEVGAPGVISTTLRGLLEGGTLTGGQAAVLARFIAERRTIVVFGDRATGKSTLLNSLFELVPVDDRFVAIERGPDLPALKERSFCVRLTVGDAADVPALFAKARRMSPGRLVVGELHSEETREFFALLAEEPSAAGLATIRAETVHRAVEGIVEAFDDDARGRGLLTRVRPVFAHMHSDEKGVPRLAAIWSAGEERPGELTLGEVPTAPAAASELAAEA